MKGYKKLPRPPKKRKTMSYKRGLNNELVSVVTAVDENDRILIEIACSGNPGADSIIDALDKRIESHSIFTTDSKPAYQKVAKLFDSKPHQIPSGFHTDAINELHSSLKSWFVKFKGVSTRHLERYLAWFRFKRLLNYHQEADKHNRITRNNSIKERVRFLIKSIHSAPFPIEIFRPYS